MLIACDHCGQIWEFKDSAIPEIQAIFRTHTERRIGAELIKALKQPIGLPLLSVKQLADHATKNNGHCFSCNSPLNSGSKFIKNCSNCGALNLDLQHA